MHPEDMARRDAILGLLERQASSAAQCPFNANHAHAVAWNAKYPSCGARYPAPGTPVGVNNLVSAKGDTAHRFVAPTSKDIRGSRPGLNTAANHGFLACDGVTTFGELVDAQQNVDGVGHDLAVLLVTWGVGIDGDLVTTKLSVGYDATTMPLRGLRRPQIGPAAPGLDGHNKFEGDTSLTRNNYFTAAGDHFCFNSTLYAQMLRERSCNKAGCSLANIARYRKAQFDWSLGHNGKFYYGRRLNLLYGAASLSYELFPSLGDQGKPDLLTMELLLPPRNSGLLTGSPVSHHTPFPDVSNEIFEQYEAYPAASGGNTGRQTTFVDIGQLGPYILNTTLSPNTGANPAGDACSLLQLATENTPSMLGGGDTPLASTLAKMFPRVIPVCSRSSPAADAHLKFNGIEGVHRYSNHRILRHAGVNLGNVTKRPGM